ncbi:MAG: rhodanese-like domain-containing protein [Bacteroidia bacterium]
MNSILKTLSAVLMATFLSCSGQAQQGQGKAENISTAAFSQMIAQTEGVQLVDVRTPGEWEKGTLAGARRINWMGNDFEIQAAKLDTLKPVLIYCASGARSSKAIQKLNAMGFQEIYNLSGGIKAWEKAGLEVVK